MIVAIFAIVGFPYARYDVRVSDEKRVVRVSLCEKLRYTYIRKLQQSPATCYESHVDRLLAHARALPKLSHTRREKGS